ncbi:MAG: DUF2189 domain-containing protein [Pseudomonadota bacterium]
MIDQTPHAPSVHEASPPVGFPDAPGVRSVGWSDISGALRQGVGDFLAAPLFGLFFGGVFAVGGWALLACVAVWDTPWAILPLAIAFPLLGPFAAVGLYEVSRRLTTGEPLNWSEVLTVVLRQKDRQLAWMGFVTLFIFWMWAYQVRLLLALFLGFASFSSFDGFMTAVLTTENGLTFLAVGTVIGAILSLGLFSVTVISMPLLVDRDYDIITAIVTSVTAVRRSPIVMLAWGACVTLAMLAAMAPAFLGLFVVLPILGHATWRLYERAIVRV